MQFRSHSEAASSTLVVLRVRPKAPGGPLNVSWGSAAKLGLFHFHSLRINITIHLKKKDWSGESLELVSFD